MLTRDDFKNLLMADVDDKAGQIDKAVEEYSNALFAAEDAIREKEGAEKQLEESRKTIGELTTTNMKLLEKIKYADDKGSEGNEGGEEVKPEDITIEDLFKD